MSQIPVNETPSRKKIVKKPNLVLISMSITLILLLITASVLLFLTLPTFQQVELNPSIEINIYFLGQKTKYSAIEQENQLYVPFEFIKDYIDNNIQWDTKSNLAIITTAREVYHFPLGQRDGLLNLQPYSLTYPIIEENSVIYLPIEPLNSLYDIEFNNLIESSILLVNDLTQPTQKGIVTNQTRLREKATLLSGWIANINAGQELTVTREEDGWYWIQSDNGQVGYVEKSNVELTEIITAEITKKIYQPWNPIGKPVVLTWEHVITKNPDTSKIGNLSSLQVVSPTWFHLQKKGLVTNIADVNYVNWAHQQGFQLWGLFSNSFDLDITHEMLNDVDLRINVIKQLLSYVELYQLDGINLDFENVYLEDKELLVQFVRELTPLMHEKDRTVSMDVTFISSSDNWSMFYDRKSLGEIVDYLIVMGYDEHWSSSPIAGSVASLPWVENGLIRILEEVPNEKVILGVPFYTRLWTEVKDESGKITVSSKAFSMEQTIEWIAKNNLPILYDAKSGQNYAELIEGNNTYKVWIEDELSMQKRIDIMKKYRLAGIAAWRRGFETADFWSVFAEYISSRP